MYCVMTLASLLSGQSGAFKEPNLYFVSIAPKLCSQLPRQCPIGFPWPTWPCWYLWATHLLNAGDVIYSELLEGALQFLVIGGGCPVHYLLLPACRALFGSTRITAQAASSTNSLQQHFSIFFIYLCLQLEVANVDELFQFYVITCQLTFEQSRTCHRSSFETAQYQHGHK